MVIAGRELESEVALRMGEVFSKYSLVRVGVGAFCAVWTKVWGVKNLLRKVQGEV